VRRTYWWLVCLAPRHLRERHGAEMAELFADAVERARARGRLAVALVWIGAALDIAAVWPHELSRRRRQRGRIGIPDQGRPIMLGSDIRFALRSLSRQKFATGLVVAMLAIGIAANVGVFSIVNGLFLRPFPFDDPERLMFFNEKAPRWNLEIVGINFPDFDQWRKDQKLFEALALWSTSSLNVADGNGAERVVAASVTHEMDDVLRVQPIIGRMFNGEEDSPKGEYVAVLGYGFWQQRFGGNPAVLGTTLKMNGRAHTIIGVLPREADTFPGDARLWVPFRGDPNQEGQSYGANGVGRLKAGVTAPHAEKDLLRAHQPIFDKRDRERIVFPFVQPLREIAVRDYRTAASTLSVAVGLLLAVACANVAAVMLARALARRREMGIRVAVGASRWRLLRQLFVENVVLAAIGGVLGLALGHWAIRILVAQLPDTAPPWATFGLDLRVMVFAAFASIATVLLFGWAPALHAVRGDLRSAMHNVANAAFTSVGGRRTLRVLVAGEFALATLLLIGGGLLFRAYDRVRNIDPGFDPHGVLTFTISLPDAIYNDAPKRLAFWDRAEQRMAQLAGARSVGLVNCPPFGCHWGSFYVAEGMPPRGANEASPVVLNRFATPGYFPTMGIRLESGRFFEADDGRRSEGQERIVIINQTFAKTYFPGVGNPVGRRIRSTGDNAPWNRIVGLVEDVKHYGLERPMRPGVYWPLAQRPVETMAIAIKTDGDPDALIASARTAMRELDAELPLFGVRSMEQALRRTLAVRTTYSWMLAVFAFTALLLALGGTYGVSSYLVTQRTREIGIRVALGARRGDIVRGVLHTSLAVAAGGIVLGVAASLGLSRFLESLLFGVNPTDALILSGAIAVLLFSALVANALPARRAARVDPMHSLRTE
jgi:putative ABC transport system permease protein